MQADRDEHCGNWCSHTDCSQGQAEWVCQRSPDWSLRSTHPAVAEAADYLGGTLSYCLDCAAEWRHEFEGSRSPDEWRFQYSKVYETIGEVSGAWRR